MTSDDQQRPTNQQVSRDVTAADLVGDGRVDLYAGFWSGRAAGYRLGMPEDHFAIKLSHDQALVLSDWLDRVIGTEAFDRLVDDPAIWAALYSISGPLETSLPELFMQDYKARLEAARERLRGRERPMTGE
ncbi:hypothetical protein AB0873_20775 [Micromonospora sp. NPDC047707]|uniref:hypothetical protein n=1 Tax=Micromonospora sp. NPDC047707 TaxID=3154498 RepID=UPI0034536302